MENRPGIKELKWVGSEEDFVDRIDIRNINHVTLGRFGGNSAVGQYKNEDGCLVWADTDEEWEFAMILDAHMSAESAELVTDQCMSYKEEFLHLFSQPIEDTFSKLEETVLGMFQEERFIAKCRNVQGETACLLLLRKGKYVWWFSVGDCLSFLFHPELAHHGQYGINQRQFYEWVGQVNTFYKEVPCYSSGVRELRQGMNRILLTTDGLVECPDEPWADPKKIYDSIKGQEPAQAISMLLETIRDHGVRDSTTVIGWDVEVSEDMTIPSDM
ncbi:protein phosphatase 2C domain-containing protein [Bacillus sp. KH172YL63]|uniref:protein phosphatase 2C domain-containing protein n=1 Tax=Bacillus sp. KH172YL63 TaxID=2709784 RepID=UPI0013E44D40|nr:protein phosphatase 2C domain-containing protein [Bacillus sp. KH172YL63]BCB04053.1 protein phosphatase [Bacillus sp. KH172YL63]